MMSLTINLWRRTTGRQSVLLLVACGFLMAASAAQGQRCTGHLILVNNFGSQISVTSTATVGTTANEPGPSPVVQGGILFLDATADETCHLQAQYEIKASGAQNSCTVTYSTDPSQNEVEAVIQCPQWKWNPGSLYVDGLDGSIVMQAQGFLSKTFTVIKSPNRTVRPAAVTPPATARSYRVSSDWIPCPAAHSCWGSYGCGSPADAVLGGGIQMDVLQSQLQTVQSHPQGDHEWFTESVNRGGSPARFRIWAVCAASSAKNPQPPPARTGSVALKK